MTFILIDFQFISQANSFIQIYAILVEIIGKYSTFGCYVNILVTYFTLFDGMSSTQRRMSFLKVNGAQI